MAERLNGNHVWKYGEARIGVVRGHVRLIAPCGEVRRVTPETARKIAADLLEAADNAEKAHAVLGGPPVEAAPLSPGKQAVIERALDKTDEEWEALAKQ